MIKLFQIMAFTLFSISILSTQASARQIQNDMAFICKYEANINYGVPQGTSRILPVERTHSGFIVYGQSPGNTSRALFYECRFDRRGEYRGIRKTRDNRYYGGGHGNHHIPKTARRICKGEASARWRTRPNHIRINRAKRVGRNRYIVNLSDRYQRGICEVSGSGHIFRFRTHYVGNVGSSVSPREARRACKRRASSRWGVRSSNIRIVRDRRLGRDDYNVKLAFRDYRAECEVSGRGRIYLFSEY